MPVVENREYIIENPLKDSDAKPIVTKLRAKAIEYFKKNYTVTEKHYVEIMVSKKEYISVLKVKTW